MSENQKKLVKLIKRRHPKYKEMIEHWDFLEMCYEGGRQWFKKNIFRYIKEGDEEYSSRVERSYRFNHSREVVDLVTKYIFKANIERNYDNAHEKIVAFWRRSTKSGLSIDKLIREMSKKASIFGRVWIVVDNNNPGGIYTLKEEKELNIRDFAYIVKPQDMLDISFDDEQNINWALIYETARDDKDPIDSSGDITDRYRLWTRNDWTLYEVHKEGRKTKVVEIDSSVHDLGFVPVFAHDHLESDDIYTSPAMINDIAYLDRACSNYLSNIDAIVQDQTFSQLAMPAQGLMPGDETYNKLVEMGTKRIFLYDGEHGGQPFYLSPDPRQAQIIITIIKQIINEIYHTVGMAGERTKQDNSVGIDNSSGVAKAYDFERVNALLSSKAASLRKAEIRMIEMVMEWNGISVDESELDNLIVYPETFDTRGISDEFEVSAQLSIIEAPDEVRREQMRGLVEKLFPRIKEDLKAKMMSEIESWPHSAELS